MAHFPLKSLRARAFAVLVLGSAGHPATAVELLSVRADATGPGNAASWYGKWAANGRYVVLNSTASDLVAGMLDNNGVNDVLYRDVRTGTTRLVSVALDGTGAGNGYSSSEHVSDDGRWVAFRSGATNLTLDVDANSAFDVFLRDMVAGTTQLVSRSLGGDSTASGGSEVSGISTDGRYLLFSSSASNIVAVDDTNAESDLFVYDRIENQYELVSFNAAGTGAGNDFIDYSACFSRNGRYVVFTSEASDLSATSDSNEVGDVFLRDRVTATTTLISVAASGIAAGNEPSIIGRDCVSDDGRFVLFTSEATNLVASADTNGRDDVFVRDVTAGVTTLVSINAAGTATANGYSDGFGISGDGGWIGFMSRATDVASAPGNGSQQLYLRDRVSGATTLVSHASSGGPGNADSSAPRMNRIGDRIVFASRATNLVTITDLNMNEDVFVWDGANDALAVISQRADGTATGNGRSGLAGLSEAGDISFVSLASDLAGPDGNGVNDTFARAEPMFAHGFE